MSQVKISLLTKYVSKLKKSKKKYMTSENLSKIVGVYPEVINETFSYFDPIVNIDYQYNLIDLLPQAEQYIHEHNLKLNSEDHVKKDVITKAKLKEYESIADFIYKKMTVGGIFDKSALLSDRDLRMLKRLINDEQKIRKLKSNKKKTKRVKKQ